jgi:serine/threonine-protein kinase RsbW/stage II sporulation protein AB (anti-sigma F factor)
VRDQTVTAEPFTGTWPAVPEAVADLRRHIETFARRAGAAPEALSSIKLAVSEAATNVVLHAYPSRPGAVHVRAEHIGETLRVTVGDDGAGMLPRPDSPGLGLGLPLISQLVDSLDVRRRSGGGTEVCMRFELTG